MDTIFALATAQGRAGVAVIRVSGPQAWDAVRILAGSVPPVRHARLRMLRLDGDALDHALILTFAKGASFTGEDVAEFHIHAAPATIAVMLRALAGIRGLRAANAGEFTRRAFENGCLDLAQVEGLADLLEAETEAQRKQALRVLSGAVGARATMWRQDLVRAAALIEATIDFADEDVPVDVMPEVGALIARVLAGMRSEVAGYAAAERIRAGFEVAIVGRPNAGKSTLLNALAGRDAAITSEYAGTTRDVIEVRIEIDGLAVTLLDTAGLRDATDPVEAIGIDRALSRARAADLRVFLLDGADVPLLDPEAEDIVVHGKSDIAGHDGLGVSGKTGAGVGELLDRVGAVLRARTASAGVIVRERHRSALIAAIGALVEGENRIRGGEAAELVAEDVRRAVRAVDALIGRVDTEDLLGEIFASFCIGK